MSLCSAVRPSLCRTSCLRVAPLRPLLPRSYCSLGTHNDQKHIIREADRVVRMSTQVSAASGAGGAASLPDADAFPTLVSPEWLHQRLGEPSLKVLDATWYLPNAGKDALAEHQAERIPRSRFFGQC